VGVDVGLDVLLQGVVVIAGAVNLVLVIIDNVSTCVVVLGEHLRAEGTGVAVGVLGDDVLLESVALPEYLVAVRTKHDSLGLVQVEVLLQDFAFKHGAVRLVYLVLVHSANVSTCVGPVNEVLLAEGTGVTGAASVLGDDVLLEAEGLPESLVAVRTNVVFSALVDRLHMPLETACLHNSVALDAIDVLVTLDLLIVEKPNVAFHVAEVGKHVSAMRALMIGDLKTCIEKIISINLQAI
jgi:hypothetical protein